MSVANNSKGPRGSNIESARNGFSSMRSDFADRINAMRLQETSHYACPDYLQHYRGTNSDFSQGSASACTGGDTFNEQCRGLICQWFFRVVDHLNISRQVVLVATSYLDRFLASATCNKHMIKLAATSSLHLAVKLYEPTFFVSFTAMLPGLTRKEFSKDQVLEMERLVIRNLSWLLHPPTSTCFVHHYMALLPSASENDLANLTDVALFLAQLTALEYSFVVERPSSIAAAAILNALDLAAPPSVKTIYQCAIVEAVSGVSPDQEFDYEKISNIQRRLWALYESHSSTGVSVEAYHKRNASCSPVCVAEAGGTNRKAP